MFELSLMEFLPITHTALAVKGAKSKVENKMRLAPDGLVDIVWLVLCAGEVFDSVIGYYFTDFEPLRSG
jgi:hypothetical protein